MLQLKGCGQEGAAVLGELLACTCAYRRLGLLVHALVGTIAKLYALHNKMRHMTRVKG